METRSVSLFLTLDVSSRLQVGGGALACMFEGIVSGLMWKCRGDVEEGRVEVGLRAFPPLTRIFLQS